MRHLVLWPRWAVARVECRQRRARHGGRGPHWGLWGQSLLSPSLSSRSGLCVPHLPPVISHGKAKLVAAPRADSLTDWAWGCRQEFRSECNYSYHCLRGRHLSPKKHSLNFYRETHSGCRGNMTGSLGSLENTSAIMKEKGRAGGREGGRKRKRWQMKQVQQNLKTPNLLITLVSLHLCMFKIFHSRA